jgi:sugar O-acyltransferase (sialic acid O-acetyltransferase NeuD family)
MKDIVIIGAGDFGREVVWLIEDINAMKDEWNILGFVDDNADLLGKEFDGYKVIGNLDWLMNQSIYVVNSIANPKVREMMMTKLASSSNKYPSLIHPNVVISKRATIGEGSIITSGNIVSTGVKVGKHVIINLACTLGHDSIYDDYASLMPGVNVSGHAHFGRCVHVGTGSAVIPKVSIGEYSTLGAGSVVTKDIPPYCTAVGVPAKPIKFHQN